ncbi:MAG: J domain-containing protein [Clostridia bacterium]|nr:J domain-containing protein [Clostridia bacterium]
MRDPYEVLGITRDASLSQIKKAYKNLAKKAASLPDTQAEARMEELNNAYDAIMNNRSESTYTGGEYTANNSGSYNAYTGGYHNSGAYSAPAYSDVRRFIGQSRYDDADMILNGIPTDKRSAEWHYLKGRVLYNKGWLEDASREFEQAYRMEPANGEYRSAYENIFSKRTGGYRQTGSGRNNNSGCDACNICTGLLCADCCCESMGGDLIPCC